MSKHAPSKVSLCLTFITFFVFMSCAQKKGAPQDSVMDSPEIHFELGMKALEGKDTEGAVVEFRRSLQLDADFSKAYCGLAVVSALEGDEQGMKENLNKGEKKARTDEEMLFYHTALIRAETSLANEGWLKRCEKSYEKALKLDGSKDNLSYFMGLAYERAMRYDDAMDMYRSVIDLDAARVNEADERWGKLQRVIRAQPGSSYGRKMALEEVVSRGELAVLLLEELELDELFEKRSLANTTDGTGQVPAVPYDVRGHRFESAVMKVLPWGLRGFTVEDNLLHPDRPVTRGEFAMMVEDIIMKISGDNGLATRYITENTSPFADLDNSSPYFNSAMLTTVKGILRPDAASRFNPDGALSGADALLALRKLKELQW